MTRHGTIHPRSALAAPALPKFARCGGLRARCFEKLALLVAERRAAFCLPSGPCRLLAWYPKLMLQIPRRFAAERPIAVADADETPTAPALVCISTNTTSRAQGKSGCGLARRRLSATEAFT